MKTISEQAIRDLAEEILSDVDCDIYKEGLSEELGLIGEIEYKLTHLVLGLGATIITVE